MSFSVQGGPGTCFSKNMITLFSNFESSESIFFRPPMEHLSWNFFGQLKHYADGAFVDLDRRYGAKFTPQQSWGPKFKIGCYH